MPDPIALNNDKKIIKKKLKPPKDKLSEKYPALANMQKVAFNPSVHLSNSHRTPKPFSDETKETIVGQSKRGLGLAVGLGRGLFRGLGSLLGKAVAVQPSTWAYGKLAPRWMPYGDTPNLPQHLLKATEETYDNPLRGDMASVADNFFGLVLNKDVNTREWVDIANKAKRQRERHGDYSFNWADARTAMADYVIQPDIRKKEHQRILQERGPAAAQSYQQVQNASDELGGLYGPLRILGRIPGC